MNLKLEMMVNDTKLCIVMLESAILTLIQSHVRASKQSSVLIIPQSSNVTLMDFDVSLTHAGLINLILISYLV